MWASKLLIYGLIGLLVEVLFTGVCAAIFQRDRAATAKTYLWMLPIYGATGLLLEWTSVQVAFAPALFRGAVYLAIIYGAEYGAGAALRYLLGRCPWDYGQAPSAIDGLVRLDYAPAWFFLGLGAEAMHPLIRGVAAALTSPGVPLDTLRLLAHS